ncbi:MAG: hypothetical protein RQ826_08475 [Xanthomonadales bacterium]|nr:hypothetical protein [Xanthomonadales bacterium]
MNSSRIAAIVLVVLDVQAVVYGGFSYASETHEGHTRAGQYVRR